MFIDNDYVLYEALSSVETLPASDVDRPKLRSPEPKRSEGERGFQLWIVSNDIETGARSIGSV